MQHKPCRHRTPLTTCQAAFVLQLDLHTTCRMAVYVQDAYLLAALHPEVFAAWLQVQHSALYSCASMRCADPALHSCNIKRHLTSSGS